jgi:hypothetical protein
VQAITALPTPKSIIRALTVQFFLNAPGLLDIGIAERTNAIITASLPHCCRVAMRRSGGERSIEARGG